MSYTNWGIIIQARMGSSRLPGKVLADVVGAPALFRQIERIRRIPGNGKIVIATSDLAKDDPIADFATTLPDIGLFRGSETDVLRRYAAAAAAFNFSAVMRLTADCPLIDPDVAGLVIQRFWEHENCDYASNCRPRTYPHGFDCEVVSLRALECADAEANSSFDREHVLPYIFTRKDRFTCINVEAEDASYMNYRFTMDYPEDLDLVRAIYENLYEKNPSFTTVDILKLLENKPEILDLNRSHWI